MPEYLSLGDLMQRRRAALGLTQARLAELVGRSPSTIRSWERDRSVPAEPSAYAALSAVLGLTDEEIESAISGGRSQTPAPDATDLEGSLPGDPDPTGASIEPPPAGGSPELEADRGDRPADGRPLAARSGETGSTPAPSGSPGGDRRDPPEAGPATPSSRADETVRTEAAPPEPAVSRAVSRLPRVPSYLDDPAEVRTYRARTILTAVLLVLMLMVLVWAFGEAREALGSLFGDQAL